MRKRGINTDVESFPLFSQFKMFAFFVYLCKNVTLRDSFRERYRLFPVEIASLYWDYFKLHALVPEDIDALSMYVDYIPLQELEKHRHVFLSAYRGVQDITIANFDHEVFVLACLFKRGNYEAHLYAKFTVFIFYLYMALNNTYSDAFKQTMHIPSREVLIIIRTILLNKEIIADSNNFENWTDNLYRVNPERFKECELLLSFFGPLIAVTSYDNFLFVLQRLGQLFLNYDTL